MFAPSKRHNVKAKQKKHVAFDLYSDPSNENKAFPPLSPGIQSPKDRKSTRGCIPISPEYSTNACKRATFPPLLEGTRASRARALGSPARLTHLRRRGAHATHARGAVCDGRPYAIDSSSYSAMFAPNSITTHRQNWQACFGVSENPFAK